MSVRNRELANLVAVGALTALGFASVYIARQDVVSAGSISYALIFLGLYVAAHLVARPRRGQPTCFRSGFDCGRPDRDLPPRPEGGVSPGLLIVIVVAFSARCCRAGFCVREVQAPLRSLRDRAADPAALPHFGTTINGARLGQSGRSVPARRAGEVRADRLPRRLPARESEVLAQGRLKDFAVPGSGARRCS